MDRLLTRILFQKRQMRHSENEVLYFDCIFEMLYFIFIIGYNIIFRLEIN